MQNELRIYQREAIQAINAELAVEDKCIVKMFCGTGKSKIMREAFSPVNLLVYVFPSLALITQFYRDYCKGVDDILIVCSLEKKDLLEKGELDRFCVDITTDKKTIQPFVNKKEHKIVCVTYQSLDVFLNALNDCKIDICVFDEAHHVVSLNAQQLVFGPEYAHLYEKQVFFTATPKNDNGVDMMTKCGKLVYDYSYLTGVNQGFLNAFDIRVDMYTEHTNRSVYESIARHILSTNNGRVLTFHRDVNTERDGSVLQFVDDPEFVRAFKEVKTREFPKTRGFTKIHMYSLTAETKPKDREKLLTKFDKTPDGEVIVISSCETIGEGIDTKRANMCVFVDAKTSYTKIIQNIGRIVRLPDGRETRKSTILIPCWVDKTKYLECGGDKEKCDMVIRQDMGEGGNFNGILNVLSALRQEDEDLYDICLNYPHQFSPQEIDGNLDKHGKMIGEQVGDGTLEETVEYLGLDYDETDEYEFDEYEFDERIMAIAESNEVCIEIHTNSLDTPVSRYNEECEEVVRMYKTTDEDTGEEVYFPILEKTTGEKRTRGLVNGPNRENRIRMNVHTNPDVKVLWNITSDIDLTKDICGCVIDCEVVDNWYENLEKLKTFIDDNGRRPTTSSMNETEKKLGKWVSHQQSNYTKKHHGMKDEAKYNLWTAFLEEYKEHFKSADDIWYETFNRVKLFMDTNNKRPSSSSKEKNEKQLGAWVHNQLINYKTRKNALKDENKYNLWTVFLEEYKEYVKLYDDVWYEQFEKVKSFMDTHKKQPLQNSKNKTEKKIGKWLSVHNSNYTNKESSMKDTKKYNEWTAFLEKYKDFITNNNIIWYETFEQVKSFMDTNKTRPNSNSKNIPEKRLGSWIGDQLKNYKTRKNALKDETKYNLWTAFLEKYKEYFKSDDEIWYEMFEQLKSFMDTNKTRPNSNSKNIPEKKIGKWITSQQRNYNTRRKSMNDPKKYKLWTAFLEKYKEYFNSWNETFEQLKSFIDTHKKRPSHGSSSDESEIQLANWISNQLINYKTKKQSMNDTEKYNLWTAFLEEYKEYFKSDDDIWYEHFDKVKTFITIHKKRPSHGSSNKITQQLGSWISNQLKNYSTRQNSMSDPKKYKLWTAFLEEYKEYLKNFDDVWYEHFENVKTFMISNKNRPNTHSSDETEKQLGSWISNQNKNYKTKKHSMNDPEKYKLWTAFLEEYKDYMSPPKTKTPKKKSMKLNTSASVPSTEPTESPEQKLQRTKSVLSELHKKYKTLTSDHLHTLLMENTNLWTEYHSRSEENESTFPEAEIPRNRIIHALSQIKTTRTKRVVDMGCGKAQIAKHFQHDSRFELFNYDHVACDDTVVSCDISKTPLEENSVEICILSLAMWGSNCDQYIKEAYRILESGGTLYIIESSKRWAVKDADGNPIPGTEGERLKNKINDAGFKIIDESIEKFCMFTCIRQ